VALTSDLGQQRSRLAIDDHRLLEGMRSVIGGPILVAKALQHDESRHCRVGVKASSGINPASAGPSIACFTALTLVGADLLADLAPPFDDDRIRSQVPAAHRSTGERFDGFVRADAEATVKPTARHPDWGRGVFADGSSLPYPAYRNAYSRFTR
jgi:hypothetical protein